MDTQSPPPNKIVQMGYVSTTHLSETINLSTDEGLGGNSTRLGGQLPNTTKTPNIIKLTTADLVSWASQVARGMDYLASKRVVHGDLAARNILLCENNLVKICDFGLSRKMYNRQYHRKMPGACLPLKWLALESLTDDTFTTYSDVWSFGIVLWEFFSLGQVPYPGMELDHKFFNKIKSGYRMAKPAYANNALYKIMRKCWSTNPRSRPLFNQLETELDRLLNLNVSNYYLDNTLIMDDVQNICQTENELAKLATTEKYDKTTSTNQIQMVSHDAPKIVYSDESSAANAAYISIETNQTLPNLRKDTDVPNVGYISLETQPTLPSFQMMTEGSKLVNKPYMQFSAHSRVEFRKEDQQCEKSMITPVPDSCIVPESVQTSQQAVHVESKLYNQSSAVQPDIQKLVNKSSSIERDSPTAVATLAYVSCLDFEQSDPLDSDKIFKKCNNSTSDGIDCNRDSTLQFAAANSLIEEENAAEPLLPSTLSSKNTTQCNEDFNSRNALTYVLASDVTQVNT